jgi:hypothetical protein
MQVTGMWSSHFTPVSQAKALLIMGKTFTWAPTDKSGSAVLEPSWGSSTDSDDGAASHLSGQNLIRTNQQNIVDSCETCFTHPYCSLPLRKILASLVCVPEVAARIVEAVHVDPDGGVGRKVVRA